MKELLERFVDLEKRIAAEKGAFGLFALFLREDAGSGSGISGYSGYSAKWDLIAAAPWIEGDRKGALSYITKKLQEVLTPPDLSLLSRIVLVELTNPEVQAINRAVNIEHGQAEVRDRNFFGLRIKRGYIITSTRNIDERIPA